MKMNAGIVTPKLRESKQFYTEVLGFGVTFENDFYLLLHTPNHQTELSYLLPDHPTQAVVFQVPLRTEAWGDRHFVLLDPNGVGIDIVTYIPPA